MISTWLPGVDDPVSAGGAAEATEDLGVDDAEPGAGEHRDRELRKHRHVEGDAVAGLEPAEVAQQGGELVDPDVEVLVGDDPVLLVLGFRHPDEGRLVLVGGYVPVDAVVGGV